MIEHSTVFSPCRRYRYTLWREWPDLWDAKDQFVQFIGLNPSTADETLDDPTIRRCINFAKTWGYGAFCMTNLFAFRSTDPRALYTLGDDLVGPDNMEWLGRIAREAAVVICAWGNHGKLLGQQQIVRAMLTNAGVKQFCLGVNADGSPKHPLYLPKSSTPMPI